MNLEKLGSFLLFSFFHNAKMDIGEKLSYDASTFLDKS